MPGAVYVCTTTGARYPAEPTRWCSEAGSPLDLDFTPKFTAHMFRQRPWTMWRYREAIPLESDECIVSFQEGCTPLLPIRIDGREVFVKQDHLFPTGSYKDRGASVMISRLRELGVQSVVEDSSGNAGAAIAAYAAHSGIGCEIFVPDRTPEVKLAQIVRFGARLHRVPGPREAAASAARLAARNTCYASHVWNPYFLHGTKTCAYEICEQLDWGAPDHIVVPVGNGSLLLGLALGFRELLGAGILDRLPRFVGVQASGCAPLYAAFQKGLDVPQEVDAHVTVAEGVAIGAPPRGAQILEVIRKTSGSIVAVSDQMIMQAVQYAARSGFSVEPTGAVGLAGLRSIICTLPAEETVVTVFTGHGLKSTATLEQISSTS